MYGTIVYSGAEHENKYVPAIPVIIKSRPPRSIIIIPPLPVSDDSGF